MQTPQLSMTEENASSRGKRQTALRQLAIIVVSVFSLIAIFRQQQLFLDLYKPLSDYVFASVTATANTTASNQPETNQKKKHIHIRPINPNNKHVKISFRLHDPNIFPITHEYNQYMRCPLGDVTIGKNRNRRPTGEVRSGVLPDVFVRNENGTILSFTASISTSLKLLTIGDSVTIQFSYSMDEILGGKNLSSRTLLWDSWPGHVGGAIVYPTHGGGASATWRMTGLLSRSREGKPPPNNGGGGWSMNDVNRFLNYETDPITASTVNKFDIVIFRVMHGWMKIEEITINRLLEAIHLASELYGATTVILQTIPFTNNVKNVQDLMDVERLNQEMRNIAKNWSLSLTNENNNSTIKNVLVQEYGQYVNHVIWTNARTLGYNVSDPISTTSSTAHNNDDDDDDPLSILFKKEGPSFLFDRLNDGQQYSPSIPMVCSDLDSLGDKRDKCNRNYLFSDGMHVCPESLSVRYAVSLACLAGCVYNTCEESVVRNDDDVRGCERECNDQFMSLKPVDDEWIGENVTLASFSC